MLVIRYTKTALEELAGLGAFVGRKVRAAIEAQLPKLALVAARHRKPLQGKLAPRWQLTVGEHRVIYRVRQEVVEVLILRAVRKGRRTTDEVLGEEVDE